MLTEGSICPICGGAHLRKNTHTESYEYKGKKAFFDGFVSYHCESCNEDLVNPGENKTVEESISNFRRDIDDLLRPSEIKKIRQSLGYSQVAFANLLGVGSKSFARYETGVVEQGKSMDNLLRIISKHPETLSAIVPSPLRRQTNAERYIVSSKSIVKTTTPQASRHEESKTPTLKMMTCKCAAA